ncbi:hypothetical protein M8C21_000192 [Ambrosia artemisiifolia]|uniref:Uncharacterized protein n=1 Tax=Ambrosia artemisiifolia TaxID=4212 RepID=A0AAD5D511_AMBAR|nr:hypothetical protein M8C21_000192 [Ambrosia artemisiifolia]
MLQKVESSFKENIRRNANNTGVSTSDSVDLSPFKIELRRNESEKENAMKRYQDLEKWMWRECLYSSNLSAKAHGKQSCTPQQGICDSCHGSYCYEKAICPRCYRSFSTFGGKLCYPESNIQDNVHAANDTNDWDITHPIRIRLIKSLLTFLEASVPREALHSSWTENIRNTWGSKLHDSSSPADLLQVLTQLESVIKRDYMSLEFETTEELLKTPGLSDKVASGSVPVLPWIPQTTAAVTLRLLELDGSISYTPEQKAELKLVQELKDSVDESNIHSLVLPRAWFGAERLELNRFKLVWFLLNTKLQTLTESFNLFIHRKLR